MTSLHLDNDRIATGWALFTTATLVISFALFFPYFEFFNHRLGTVLSAENLVYIEATIVLASFVLLYRRHTFSTDSKFAHQISAIVIPIAPYLIFYFYLTHYTVAFGWDFIDYWGARALKILDYLANGQSLHIKSTDRHPLTISIAQAKALELQRGAKSDSFIAYFYLFAGLILATQIYATGLIIQGSRLRSAIVTIITCSTPIIENSFMIPGYSEVFIVNLFYAASFLTYYSLRKSSLLPLAFSFLASLSIIALKSIGILICLMLICVTVFAFSLRKPAWLIFILCILAIGISTAAVVGTDIVVFGWSINVMREEVSVKFGYYDLDVLFPNIVLASTNILFSLFVNSSFGIQFLLFFSSIYFLASTKERESGCYLTILCVASILFLYAIQMSETGRQISAVGGDVFLTRAASIFLPIAALVSFHWMSLMQIDENRTLPLERRVTL